jgi:membrane complex biogenesis BtpA family protein
MSFFPANRKLLIGVVHLAPLPGSPRWAGDLNKVLQLAVADAKAYERGGVDALFVENFGDIPFTKGPVGPETVAAMCAAGRAILAAVKLPFGFNVLRNDPRAGLALCAACDGSFVRVNVHTGAMVTDQGIIEGNASATIRYRKTICPKVLIFADVHVKHAAPLGGLPIEIAARDTRDRGLADALIISGNGTGEAAEITDLQRVRKACPSARILLGSGVTERNVADYHQADGFIVGTSLKRGGQVNGSVDVRRVASLVRHVTQL